ncbi:MAG: hypothetical protein WKF36_09625 [Candidatus Nitrosocosmicus sp.]
MTYNQDKQQKTVFNAYRAGIGILGVLLIICFFSPQSSSNAYGQNSTASNPQTQSSNFVIVPIHQHLGDNKSDIFSPGYPFRGDVSDRYTFTLNTAPVGKGYLLAQVFGSSFQGHMVTINGQNVTDSNGNFGDTGKRNWGTLTAIVDDNVLKQGANTIQIQRNADSPDNFLVDNIIINWQQQQ